MGVNDAKDIGEICKLAECRQMRRGEAILCSGGYGSKLDMPIPLLSDGDVCIATTFFSTGHINSDVYTDKGKMKECQYRNK